MHRVELKALRVFYRWALHYSHVPNAPCGVESLTFRITPRIPRLVPNAPCGVERQCGESEIF